MLRSFALLLSTVAIGVQPHARTAPSRIFWYTDYSNPVSRNSVVELGSEARSIRLNPGWVCAIPALKRARTFEARTTVCRKGADAFEFTVQCDRSRPKDHVQIRFRNPAGTIADYIEVGCRPGGSARK
jgi:hypothetical protein